MSRSDYIRLKNGGQLHAGDSYGGIATNFNYVDTKYFTNNSDGTHVVEFCVDNTMLLNTEFQSVRGGGPIENAKEESGASSFGLGLTGHYKGGAGKHFNKMLDKAQITFRLVACRLEVPPESKQKS